MALNISTTEEIKARNIANLESELNQNTPPADKAYNRVIAGMEAINFTELYKYAAERSKQNLALTATGEDLDILGAEFNLVRNPATAANLTVEIVAEAGSSISLGTSLTGDSNGLTYFNDTTSSSLAGVITTTITCGTATAVGNLDPGQTLSISQEIPGAASVATVTGTNTTGANEETDDAFRERVLFAQRAVTGGGNATDYKIWSEDVSGVQKAFPYAGRPVGASYPGDRQIYIQATTAIDPDGIAPQSLLDDVRAAVNYDPDTGEMRPPLGLIDDTLFIESISRTEIFVEITNLVTPTGLETQVETDIETALTSYFLTVEPFVVGINLESERNDTITDLTVSQVVQDVLDATGSSAEGIEFALSLGGVALTSYLVTLGELTKLGAVTFV